MTDSSTGGYLTPSASPAPLQGDSLNTFVQPIIVGLTGLPGPLVRPAFQIEPPDAPDGGTAWAAFRYTSRKSDTYPYVGHDGAGDGSDTLRRHETIDILVSFYDLGSSGLADQYAALLRDGLSISQNLEVLRTAGMGFVSCGDMTTVPVIVKQRWLYRVDLPFSVRREIVRVYPVLNLLTATAVFMGGTAHTIIADNTAISREAAAFAGNTVYIITATNTAVSSESAPLLYAAQLMVTNTAVSGETVALLSGAAYAMAVTNTAVSGESASVFYTAQVVASNAATSGEAASPLYTAHVAPANVATSGETATGSYTAQMIAANAAVSGETAAFSGSTAYTITAANAAASGETSAPLYTAQATAANTAVSGDAASISHTAQITATNAAVSGETVTPLYTAQALIANEATSGETAAVLYTAHATVANAAVSGETATPLYTAQIVAGNAAVSGETAAFASATSAPFDTATGIVAAYSTRKLLTAYAGSALRVRRSSDNTEQDIGFDGSGNLDQTALTAFVGANSGYVTIWYDQSGSVRNLTQATTTAQLRLVNAGAVDTINTRVSPYAPTSGAIWYSYENSTAFITSTTIEFFQIGSTSLTNYARFMTGANATSTDWNDAGTFTAMQIVNSSAFMNANRNNNSTNNVSYTAGTLVSVYSNATPLGHNIITTAGSGFSSFSATNFSISNLMLSRESPTGDIQCGIGYRSEFVITNANQATPATFTAEQKTYWGAS